MNLRRKYINQAFTQPGSGFLKQGSESARSPPTSFLIQLVSICPGSQPAASQRGGSSCNSIAHCYFQAGSRTTENSFWILAGEGQHPFPALRGMRGAENSHHFQPLWFPAPAQVQVQTCPSHTSPTLGQGHAGSTHLLEASPHFKGIPRRAFAGAALPSKSTGNKSSWEIGPKAFNVALWPFPKCSRPTRLAGLNFTAKCFERLMCF